MAFGLFAVPAGPPGLLIIGFYIFGHLIMNDIRYVGFIDAHAKGVGSHHDWAFIINKRLLAAFALFCGHAGMVFGRGVTVLNQQCANLVNRFAGSTVDNTGSCPAAAPEEIAAFAFYDLLCRPFPRRAGQKRKD